MKPPAFAAVHLVTSRQRLTPGARTPRDEAAALARFLDEAIEAAVDIIQIRESDLEARLLCEFVTGVVERSRGTATRVLVNDRADVALAASADGLHLPARGLPAPEVRRLHRDWTVGLSVHSGVRTNEGHAAVGDPSVTGVDYLMFGTVFPSESKPRGSPVAGLAGLGAVLRLTDRPVIAIGGMTPAGARGCAEAGAAGVAAIGLFLPVGHAPDALGVRQATALLREALAAGGRSSRDRGSGNLLE